jgi:hypothetical protein
MFNTNRNSVRALRLGGLSGEMRSFNSSLSYGRETYIFVNK